MVNPSRLEREIVEKIARLIKDRKRARANYNRQASKESEGRDVHVPSSFWSNVSKDIDREIRRLRTKEDRINEAKGLHQKI